MFRALAAGAGRSAARPAAAWGLHYSAYVRRQSRAVLLLALVVGLSSAVEEAGAAPDCETAEQALLPAPSEPPAEPYRDSSCYVDRASVEAWRRERAGVLVDTRAPSEYQALRIPGSLQLPARTLADGIISDEDDAGFVEWLLDYVALRLPDARCGLLGFEVLPVAAWALWRQGRLRMRGGRRACRDVFP